MTKDEAATALRQKIEALSIEDLGLLIKIASEGINDIPACVEIADVVGMPSAQLQEWAERVLYASGAETDLVPLAETAMGWYENLPVN
jgi:alkyl sulfatase BDS1-like metallo-beta-lactamase superfamily hydrolase